MGADRTKAPDPTPLPFPPLRFAPFMRALETRAPWESCRRAIHIFVCTGQKGRDSTRNEESQTKKEAEILVCRRRKMMRRASTVGGGGGSIYIPALDARGDPDWEMK